ncbi:MAG: HotDog domain-containing protein [Benjaminiella poitrasii]|nr:MAG: HotDog domain-containing protein [Benjaminiella poitrasii]
MSNYTTYRNSDIDELDKTADIKEEGTETIDFALRMRNAIDVKLIDTDLYMSKELWLPFGSRGAFGGQIVAQALKAAWETVPEDFFVHSLHAYFILACNAEIPVIYEVQRIRDGKSFATRIVNAKQKGKAIFVCTCSFATKYDENIISLSHQTEMPNVVAPEALPSDVEVLQNVLTMAENIPEKLKKKARKRLAEELPVDYRAVTQYTPEEIITGNITPNPCSQRWFKTRDDLNDDEDAKLHACIVAYASDSGFVSTSAAANGYSLNSSKIGMMTSLDHSIWFHTANVKADDWLLYDIHSPRTNQGRGMVFGRIYSRDGTLIATTAQEGVVRLSEHEQQKRRQRQQEMGSSSLTNHNSGHSKL